MRLKYLHSFIDKRRGRAKVRHYFRRRGQKQIALPGIYGSVEFNEAYAVALASGVPIGNTIGAKRIRVGSIDALVIAYFNSPAFLALSPSTQAHLSRDPRGVHPRARRQSRWRLLDPQAPRGHAGPAR